MTLELTCVDAFTGIGGFVRGFHDAGIRTTDMIEWDPHCQTILRRQFPTIPLKGDIADVHAADLTGRRPDIVAGGFPCQGTSTGAPHRLGLTDERSHHFFDLARLVFEFGRLLDGLAPTWVVLENPAGLLKSNAGRDMATVARTLEELGYGWAYRLVDARHLGSAARRPRLLMVGLRGGDPRSAWDVLGDPAGSGETPASHRVRSRGTVGPAAGGSAAFDAVWRKSARPRAALSAGGYETWVADGNGNVLTGFDGGGPARQTHLIAQGGRLRTLTLTEWERLQGYPDGWTSGIPESARYTALGNTVHTGTTRWLGNRLVAAHHNLIGA